MKKALQCATCILATFKTSTTYSIQKFYTPSDLGISIAKNKQTFDNRWNYDKPSLLNQIDKWATHIPWIKPYYAVKSNPLPYVLRDITAHIVKDAPDFKVGLDVASVYETNHALQYTPLENTIYTNPHTILYEYNKAGTQKYNLKVVDSLCELDVLQGLNQFAPLLIRINSGIQSANINFDSKFGATLDEARAILAAAKMRGFQVKGVSFHIGSGGDFPRKTAYIKAYSNACPLLDHIRKEFGVKTPILNFGGGLLYDTDLSEALGWTKNLPYQMMAEPGRYFSEPSHHLAIQVIAITPRGVFIDNGVYHELNVLHRDHWHMPKLGRVLDGDESNAVTEFQNVRVFGPTCDSYDTLGVCELPKNIQVGDWILLPNMGAYTSAGTVNFNGIRGASSTES